LKPLAEMGYGDEIVLAAAHFSVTYSMAGHWCRWLGHRRQLNRRVAKGKWRGDLRDAPLEIFGEGPAIQSVEKGHFDGQADVAKKPFTAEDIRFTQSKDGKMLYAVVLEIPNNAKAVRCSAWLGGTDLITNLLFGRCSSDSESS
jgi:hypothetical protein